MCYEFVYNNENVLLSSDVTYHREDKEKKQVEAGLWEQWIASRFYWVTFLICTGVHLQI